MKSKLEEKAERLKRATAIQEEEESKVTSVKETPVPVVAKVEISGNTDGWTTIIVAVRTWKMIDGITKKLYIKKKDFVNVMNEEQGEKDINQSLGLDKQEKKKGKIISNNTLDKLKEVGKKSNTKKKPMPLLRSQREALLKKYGSTKKFEIAVEGIYNEMGLKAL
jgi:hypothetical protein